MVAPPEPRLLSTLAPGAYLDFSPCSGKSECISPCTVAATTCAFAVADIASAFLEPWKLGVKALGEREADRAADQPDADDADPHARANALPARPTPIRSKR